MFLISNRVQGNEKDTQLLVGNVVPQRETINERRRKDLRVDTFFCDIKTSMDNNVVKTSVASLVLAVVIQDNSIVLPSWENYRGIFCHHCFRMNRLSHYSYFEWTDWINSTTILQTSFFDSYDDIVLKGKVVTLISLGMGEFAVSKFDDKESLLDSKTEEFILQNEDLASFLNKHKDYHVITSSENTDMMNILKSKNFSFIQPEAKSMFEFITISDVASPQGDSFIVPNYLSNKDHWK